MVHLKQPQLSGLGRNPAAPLDVMMRVAVHPAGRHGLEMRRGQLPDEVAQAVLTHGGPGSAVNLSGRRVSPQMRQRIASHPDLAIRDANPAFVRHTVSCRLPLALDDLIEVYGKPPAELAADPDPNLRAVVAQVWRKRPMTVQVALLTDPDPGVRAEAAGSGGPGVPAGLVDQCLADPAVRARLARKLMLTPEQFARLMC